MSGYNTNLIETKSVVIGGDPSVFYTLSVRVRGSVERMAYEGGVQSGPFVTGGTPKPFPNTIVKLVVNTPAQTYYLNNGVAPTDYSIALDYYANIVVAGGATLTLSLSRGDHDLHKEDQGGGVVQTSVNAIDGEYVQLDFVNTLEGDVTERRAQDGTCRGWVFSGYEENVLANKAEK